MNMKGKTPTVAAVSAAVFLFSLLGAATSFAQGKQDFTLHNKTGKVLEEVYVGPTDSEDWGDDVMGQDTVGEDQSVHITFNPKAKADHWDLKIVFEDGSSSVWTNFDLTTIDEITVSYKDGKPWATWK